MNRGGDKSEPRVGIFWLFDGQLIIDSTPVPDAEPYGVRMTHAISHIDHWTKLQERGKVPGYVEYEEPPRGRVVMDTQTQRWIIYADVCIRQSAMASSEIFGSFNLPTDKTDFRNDGHYRCAVCLSRRANDET